MAINTIATALRDTLCNAFVDAIDDGTAGGVWEIEDSGNTTTLAVCEFAATAFGSSSSGVATAAAIGDDSSADNTGVAAEFTVSTSNSQPTPLTNLYQGSVSTSGADLNLNTTSITALDVVSITSATITMPAG